MRLPYALAFMRLSFLANMFAKMVPLMLCQAQEMAHGTTDIGLLATKNVIAKFVPRPAFCMPTSMESVRFLAVENWQSRPTE